jgi:hypothetical protein
MLLWRNSRKTRSGQAPSLPAAKSAEFLFRLAPLASAFALFASFALAAAEYRAGVARVDITPPIGHEMGGYPARKHGSTGLHDPLYATVLVLESVGNSIALVTCDLRSFVSTRVGELARQKFGIAPGDINPYYDKTPLMEDALSVMKQTGQKLGAEAVRVARSIQTRAAENPCIQTKTVVLTVANQWNTTKLEAGLKARYRTTRASRGVCWRRICGCR